MGCQVPTLVRVSPPALADALDRPLWPLLGQWNEDKRPRLGGQRHGGPLGIGKLDRLLRFPGEVQGGGWSLLLTTDHAKSGKGLRSTIASRQSRPDNWLLGRRARTGVQLLPMSTLQKSWPFPPTSLAQASSPGSSGEAPPRGSRSSSPPHARNTQPTPAAPA